MSDINWDSVHYWVMAREQLDALQAENAALRSQMDDLRAALEKIAGSVPLYSTTDYEAAEHMRLIAEQALKQVSGET